MSDEPKHPLPTDFEVLSPPRTQTICEAVLEAVWDPEAGCIRTRPILVVTPNTLVKSAKTIDAVKVPFNADGTLTAEQIRAAIAEARK